jgi:sugar phosphate isomerase/epimerase
VTVGNGHDALWWREFCAALRLVGYDDVLSIEHEDQMLSPIEGVRRSVDILRAAAVIPATAIRDAAPQSAPVLPRP